MTHSLQLDATGSVLSNVIPFVRPVVGPATESAARLSMRDRMDVAEWRERACQLGYDRLVIHERSSLDPPEVESFLSVYRQGARWASWTLVRHGGWVVAWRSATGADAGHFGSVSEALLALLDVA
jgi:hypothetical protein